MNATGELGLAGFFLLFLGAISGFTF